ncbi:EGF-like domain-containing protein comC isoform X1 [Actinia tenebrosa]|uniref:EGF-like domain-containing protein comC isoform X1 n=1 Tax=Actinia tenebrosa TaxID=6105 RepID=A0A6P8II53_ACTTE|nr:EGF-like domain-containing protein comC isoform X1 [Actinia tenebrosa]
MGSDCSIIPTCLNVSSCSGHGKCVNFDVCKCDKDWTGKDCSQYSCSDLDRCSDHGRCVNVYQCECNAGWTGITCAIPDCPDVHQCSGNGTCVAPNKCQCYPGYSGNGCLDSADCNMLANCSNHGDCVSGDGANSSCRCYDGFQGVDCGQPTCTELNNCSNHGICKEAGFCECDIGFSGSDCSNASCEALNFCSGHGECTGYDLCNCEASWYGAACSTPDCSALSDCSKQGVCLAPNKCDCYPGYDGIKCDKPATPNFYPPVFSSPVYNLSVYENATLGSFVGQVNASDLDQGRNGDVMYFLSNDAGGLFTVEGESGKIFTSKSLRYDELKTDFAILGVRASDNGKPMKFDSCELYIRIIDVNDNCPIFDPFLQTSYNISVNTKIGAVIANVSAVDKDNGVNGDVRYNLENGNGTFSIEWLTGSIRLMLLVRPISYQVVVIARDQGTPSCSTSLKLVFNVTERETPEPTEVTTSAEVSTTVTTTTKPVTTPSEPNIIHSGNDSLRLESVLLIAGCSIGICLLAAISTVIIIRIKRKRKANNTTVDKINTLPRASQMMTGSRNRVSPDFQDDQHDMELQVWTNIHANRGLNEFP